MGRFTLNFVDLTTVSVKSVGTLLSPCPPNVGVKDLLSYLRQTKLGERGDERERKNSVRVVVSQLFFSKPFVYRMRMGESMGEGLWTVGGITKHIVRKWVSSTICKSEE